LLQREEQTAADPATEAAVEYAKSIVGMTEAELDRELHDLRVANGALPGDKAVIA
jgi:hypothetical protein